MIFQRSGCPTASWYWRTIRMASSFDSEPPDVNIARVMPAGASAVKRVAYSSWRSVDAHALWRYVRVADCAAITSAISWRP
jgi:hypothetical protein